MAIKYKLYADFRGVPQQAIQVTADNGTISSVPFDDDNTEYIEYKAWLGAGNTPEAAD